MRKLAAMGANRPMSGEAGLSGGLTGTSKVSRRAALLWPKAGFKSQAYIPAGQRAMAEKPFVLGKSETGKPAGHSVTDL